MEKGQIVGFDVDMGKAIARELGVRASFRNVRFDDILPAIKSGTYDIGLSSFTDTRQRERSLDFVTYFSAGTSLMVKQGNPLKLSPSGLSLCGRRIAVQKGTTQADEITPRSSGDTGRGTRVDRCKDAGRPAPKRVAVSDEDAADTALREGRADAVLADSPVAGYAVKESVGKFEVVGKTYDTAPYGVAIPKNETELRNAILKVVQDQIADGSY